MTGWSRRQLLGAMPAAAAAGAGWTSLANAEGHRWNLLCVVVDSLPAAVVGPHPTDPSGAWAGAMPALGALARQGFVFRRAQAVHPEPLPGLAALWTGRPGSETGAMVRGQTVARTMPLVTDWIADQGAADVWLSGGPGIPGRNPAGSVRVLLSDPGTGAPGNLDASRAMSHAIRNRAPGRPWLGVLRLRGLSALDDLVTSWAGLPRAPDMGLPDRMLPPVPDRTIPDDEPSLVASVLRGHSPAKDWSDAIWRHYLWCVRGVLAELDRSIAMVVDTLAGSIHARSTSVMVVAASGHPLGQHGLVHARAPYASALEVPWVMVGPPSGGAPALVSGLDFAPTLCDLFGAPPMPDSRGRSIRPLLAPGSTPWRSAVRSESLVDGRTLRTDEFAYTRMVGDISEMLFQMNNDPLQLRNLALEAGYASVVESHRAMLDELSLELRPTTAANAGFRGLPPALQR